MLWSLRIVSGMAAMFVSLAPASAHEIAASVPGERLCALPHVLDHDRRAEGREADRRRGGADLQHLAVGGPRAIAALVDAADDLAAVHARFDARGAGVTQLEGDHAVQGRGLEASADPLQ